MKKHRQKIMLVAGCSHSAGSEIDGTDDSAYNREHSFGNQLAKIRGYTPINIAISGHSNPAIARSVLDWFDRCYDPESMDVFVCVGWTESIRVDCPSPYQINYRDWNASVDHYTDDHNNFLQVNAGWAGNNYAEQRIIPYWQDFQVRQPVSLELISINAVLQLQYFFQMHGVDYIMCNTMHMFTTPCEHLDFYIKLVHRKKYYGMLDNSLGFFWHYRNRGYENPKAKYWHHGEQAHLEHAHVLNGLIENPEVT